MAFRFDFNVGQTERHRVEFVYRQLVGGVTIRVDGYRVRGNWVDVRPFRYSRDYRFAVGEGERHDVLIRRAKPTTPLAAMRPHTITVFVDGKKQGEYRTK